MLTIFGLMRTKRRRRLPKLRSVTNGQTVTTRKTRRVQKKEVRAMAMAETLVQEVMEVEIHRVEETMATIGGIPARRGKRTRRRSACNSVENAGLSRLTLYRKNPWEELEEEEEKKKEEEAKKAEEEAAGAGAGEADPLDGMFGTIV